MTPKGVGKKIRNERENQPMVKMLAILLKREKKEEKMAM